MASRSDAAYESECVAPFDSKAVNQALRGLQAGDRSCAEVVFRQLWPIVSAFCRKALGDGGQDMAQETLLKLFQQAGGFRPRADAVAWALEIARWECRTELRRRGRSRAGIIAAAEPQPGGTLQDEQLERAQLSAALEDSIAHLSVADQSVVTLLLQETFPPTAGAADRKRKERALTRLKGAWRLLYGLD